MTDIYYIQSYDLKANIGAAYNRHIKCLPDDCWVVISDHDSNYLIPDFGKQLHDIIAIHGEEYALLSCITNRLRGLHQLHENRFSNEHDMQKHFAIALDRYNNRYAEVEEVHGVAGVMLMFKKSTWEKVGGFVENNIACDTEFNQEIKRHKIGKIGLMQGVYLYHCYRMWHNSHEMASNDVRHLIK